MFKERLNITSSGKKKGETNIKNTNKKNEGSKRYKNKSKGCETKEINEKHNNNICIYCNRVVTRWQWLFYMYTKHEIGY
jgi:hypothetical protein